VLVWGRTPAGKPGRVTIQWLSGNRWRGLVKLKTDSNGVFTARPKLPKAANIKNAFLRAAQPSNASPSFSLYHPPDIIVSPFG
jgi:hypothetical protein